MYKRESNKKKKNGALYTSIQKFVLTYITKIIRNII